MLETFYRTTASGDNVNCSKYFHQQTRKRRTTDVNKWLNLMPDADTGDAICQFIFEDHDAGVLADGESDACEECCEKVKQSFCIMNSTSKNTFKLMFKDDADNWIVPPAFVRGKLFAQPSDMAKAMRRVMGAAKKWGQRWIKDCGGQQGILNGDRTP